MKDLLEAGVHFGHQTKRWNPKMKEFIFGERNGIYIIDLNKTVKKFRDAEEFVTNLAADGRTVLFVGTKRQAQDVIAEEAQRCGHVLHQPALAGRAADQLHHDSAQPRPAPRPRGDGDRRPLRHALEEGDRPQLEKGEAQAPEEPRRHPQMSRLPDALFVVDTRKEKIAVDEARKLKIPVIGVVDTNCDPDEVDYVIPGNDDALRAIRLFASKIADAVLGRPRHARVGERRPRRRGRGRRRAPATRARPQRAPAPAAGAAQTSRLGVEPVRRGAG